MDSSEVSTLLHFDVSTKDWSRNLQRAIDGYGPRVVGSQVAPIDDKPRTVPIDLGATGRWHDSYDITLRAGLVVDETPDSVDLDVDFASYRSSVTVKGNVLHYDREYIVRQVQIPADKAAAFRKLQGAILADEKGTAVLKRRWSPPRPTVESCAAARRERDGAASARRVE